MEMRALVLFWGQKQKRQRKIVSDIESDLLQEQC